MRKKKNQLWIPKIIRIDDELTKNIKYESKKQNRDPSNLIYHILSEYFKIKKVKK